MEQFIRVCERFISVNKTNTRFDLGEQRVNVCFQSEFAVKPVDARGVSIAASPFFACTSRHIRLCGVTATQVSDDDAGPI